MGNEGQGYDCYSIIGLHRVNEDLFLVDPSFYKCIFIPDKDLYSEIFPVHLKRVHNMKPFLL